MGYLSVDQLKPGMALATDVTDVNGRLLLSKDSEIEAKHIKMFKMWGVGDVKVAGDQAAEGGDGQDSDPQRLAREARALQQRFRFNDLRHALIKEIFALSVQHRCRNAPADDLDADDRDRDNQDRDGDADGPVIHPPPSDVRANIGRQNVILPEIPSIVYELNEVTADPFASADDIARVVSKSPSLAALLLKIVNSAFYGFPSRIDSIARAVTLIGSKEISALGLGISTMRIFKDIPQQVIDVQAFFKHSLACGIIARALAAQLNMQHTEQLFVSGLLHDIGRVLVFKYFPEPAAAMLKQARASGELLYLIESSHLGCRHTHIGKDLMHKWKLPYSLENSTYYHHSPSRAADPARAAIVHLSDICVHALGLGSSGETFVPPLDDAAVAGLNVSPGIVRGVLNQSLHQLDFLETMFESQA